MDGDTITTEASSSCAIEVHKHLGPGLPESVYESALCIELKANSLPFKRQIGVPLYYKGAHFTAPSDLIVDDKVIVEVKSVEALCTNPHGAIAYLSEGDLSHVGLILNVNSATMKHGTRRVVNALTHG